MGGPAPPGGEQLVHTGPGLSAPIISSLGYRAAGQLDLQCRNLPLKPPPEPPSSPGSHCPVPAQAPGPERPGARAWGGRIGGWAGPADRPLPGLSSAVPQLLPKILENKFPRLPASQPLKERGLGGGGKWQCAAASSPALAPSPHPTGSQSPPVLSVQRPWLPEVFRCHREPGPGVHSLLHTHRADRGAISDPLLPWARLSPLPRLCR